MPDHAIHRADISVHFARVVFERACERGMDAGPLLKVARLTPDVLAQPQARISAQQLGALMRSIWLGLDDELFGLGAAPHRFGCFALMGRQMVECQTLEQALRYSFRFMALTSHALRWEYSDRTPGMLVLELLDPARDVEHLLEEFQLLIWHRFCNWLIGERIPLLETRFRFAPTAHRQEYALMFPGPVSFGHPQTALLVPPDYLEKPIVRTREELRDYLQRLPDEWFIKQVFAGGVSERVMAALEESGLALTLDELAQKWHMSRRTLHRQLQREGSSFRRLRDQARMEKAVTLLLGGSCQVREVAWQLQMTEPAFSRAFKSWTGMTPLAYRNMRLPPRGASQWH